MLCFFVQNAAGFGSWSDRPRNAHDVAAVFSHIFGASLFMAGAIFGDVGG